jgi:hypothetical protein
MQRQTKKEKEPSKQRKALSTKQQWKNLPILILDSFRLKQLTLQGVVLSFAQFQ